MGSLISKFRKKATTKEKLEQIDEDIERIQSLLSKNREQQKTVALYLIVASLVAYLLAVGIFYMFYMPTKWSERLLYFVPFLVFPILVFGMKRCLHFIFVTRISKNSRVLDDLKKEKKKILENVMETETYKVAKEILEKFDPDRKLVEKNSGIIATPDTRADQELRKRNLSPNNSGQSVNRPMIPNQGLTPRIIASPNMRTPVPQNGQQFVSPMRGPIGSPLRPMLRPVAPILPRDRSFVDKLAEYFVGDGPSNRYALICKQCFSHNGMALAEEFTFTSFKCCYCGFFNPARQQRLNAPKLEQQPTPMLTKQLSSEKQFSSEKQSNDASDADDKNGVGDVVEQQEKESLISSDDQNAYPDDVEVEEGKNALDMDDELCTDDTSSTDDILRTDNVAT